MSGAKEIRVKIKSIQSTQKITSAMEMVAASKMRKAQQRMLASRPYADRIRTVIEHLAYSHSEYRHPFLVPREEKAAGIIVVSSDRGLCGGLNANLFRAILREHDRFEKSDISTTYCTIGSKAEHYFKRLNVPLMATTSRLGDTPEVSDVIGAVGVMLKAFGKGEIDSIYIAYNQFINTMTQKPAVRKILPIAPDSEFFKDAPSKTHYWDYLYEPDAKELLDALLTRFIEAQVYHAVVENFACEQSSRMIAMKSASENASELIDNLQLVYNKARQAAITQELSEIVGGAAAV